MKNLIFIILTWSLFTACETNQKVPGNSVTSKAVSLVLDVTDPRGYWPTPEQMLQQFNCKETPDAECVFRLRSISDKRLTPITMFHLADTKSMDKENTENDPQFRNKNITAFYAMTRKAITDFYKKTDTSQSLTNSECFATIADELAFLAKDVSDQKLLIVVSDLMEKSTIADFYTNSTSNTKLIIGQLDRANLLPQNLTGISVIFLFNPRDRKEDQAFGFIASAYKQLLESKGAEVKIQANL